MVQENSLGAGLFSDDSRLRRFAVLLFFAGFILLPPHGDAAPQHSWIAASASSLWAHLYSRPGRQSRFMPCLTTWRRLQRRFMRLGCRRYGTFDSGVRREGWQVWRLCGYWSSVCVVDGWSKAGCSHFMSFRVEWPSNQGLWRWFGPGISGSERAQIEAGLEQRPGDQLVIVRFTAGHSPFDEWVHQRRGPRSLQSRMGARDECCR